jgi:hypothetical protein
MMDVYDVELVIVEHVISMSATSIAVIEPKLLSIQEKLVIINMVDVTENFPLKKLFKNFEFLCKLKV